jgi:Holliday junction resolvase RusA-like endonuclease
MQSDYVKDVSIDVDGVGHVYRVHSVVTNTYDDDEDKWYVECGHTVYITPVQPPRTDEKPDRRVANFRKRRAPAGIALFSMGSMLTPNQAANITSKEYMKTLSVDTYMNNLTKRQCNKTWASVRRALDDTVDNMMDNVRKRGVMFCAELLIGERYCE